MIYSNQGKFSFYSFLAEFDSTDGKQKQYTNDKLLYEDMVKNFSYKFYNLSFSTVLPTEYQAQRLEILNGIHEDNKDTWGTECSLFVQYGAIPEGTNSNFLLEIQDQYSTETQAYITELKAQKWNEIKEHRSALTINGGYKASGKWFHSDPFSRSQQLGLVLLDTNIPTGLLWKTMDGSFIEMTPALAKGVFQAATIQDTLLFAHAEGLNTSLQALTSPDEIASFAIKEGWPETYMGTAA